MGELDQTQASTSTFHSNEMNAANVKMKRIQRLTRQFSIFVHGDEAEVSQKNQANKKQEETNDDGDKVFKYPGNLRGIKRKRVYTPPSRPVTRRSARRKLFEHQDSVQESSTNDETKKKVEEKTEVESKTSKPDEEKNADAE